MGQFWRAEPLIHQMSCTLVPGTSIEEKRIAIGMDTSIIAYHFFQSRLLAGYVSTGSAALMDGHAFYVEVAD